MIYAIFSEHAEKVELCLFDAHRKNEALRGDLKEQSDWVGLCHLPEARPLSFSRCDNANVMPRCRIINQVFVRAQTAFTGRQFAVAAECLS